MYLNTDHDDYDHTLFVFVSLKEEAIFSVLSDNSFLFLLRLLSFFRQLVFMQQFLHFTPIKPETNQGVRRFYSLKAKLKIFSFIFVSESYPRFC